MELNLVLMLYFYWFDAMWFYLYNLILWFPLDWMSTLDLEEAEHPMFFKLVECLRLIWGSCARDVLEVWVFKESLHLQRSFNLRGKLESWKKSCIFKGVSIFEDDRLQDLGSLVVLGRILSGLSEVKNFWTFWSKKFLTPIMRRTPLFIEFTSGFYELEPSWSMDQTHGLNHMNLGFSLWAHLSLFFGLIELSPSQ